MTLYGRVVLDLRRLRILRAVVRTGSIRAAAVQLGYTPSAISQHVTALERETNAVLKRASDDWPVQAPAIPGPAATPVRAEGSRIDARCLEDLAVPPSR